MQTILSEEVYRFIAKSYLDGSSITSIDNKLFNRYNVKLLRSRIRSLLLENNAEAFRGHVSPEDFRNLQKLAMSRNAQSDDSRERMEAQEPKPNCRVFSDTRATK